MSNGFPRAFDIRHLYHGAGLMEFRTLCLQPSRLRQVRHAVLIGDPRKFFDLVHREPRWPICSKWQTAQSFGLGTQPALRCPSKTQGKIGLSLCQIDVLGAGHKFDAEFWIARFQFGQVWNENLVYDQRHRADPHAAGQALRSQ